MANYANLLATIAANIYTNNNNEVTAAMVKSAVDAMVASLGAGYQFMGVATPATNPGTPDAKVFYIASTPGTYTYFVDSGGAPLVVNEGECAVLTYQTAWDKNGRVAVAPAYNNLFDKDGLDVSIGKYLFADGTLGDSPNYNTSGFIPVKPSTTYYAAKGGARFRFVNFYKDDMQVISQSGNVSSFTTPNNCYWIRVTFFAAYFQTAQITEGSQAEYSAFSPISEYLFASKYTGDRLPIKVLGKNLLNPAGYGGLVGYYLQSDGTENANGNYCVSPYIPLSSGKLIASVRGVPFVGSSAAICYYDDNYGFISGHTVSSTKGIATWFSGVAYVRFSIFSPSFSNVQIEEGDKATGYEPFGYYIPEGDLPPKKQKALFCGQRTSGTLAPSGVLQLPLIYSRYSQSLSAIINGTIGAGENIQVGRGISAYGGGAITLGPDSISIGGETYAHGLTLTARTEVILLTKQDQGGYVRIVTSSGQVFEQEVTTSIGGEAYVKNNTASNIDVALSFEPRKIKSSIWVSGDSYLGFGVARWPYYAIDWGLENYLIDNLSGGTAEDLWMSLENLLIIGRPKYLVWCLGMNGADDEGGAVNQYWMNIYRNVEERCTENGIELILATIPSVPSRTHEALNDFVRNSGYRYIDFAEAVNAQPDGTWDAGLLSDDNVHPTAEGAKVLASRVLIDFPEISAE